MRLRSLASILLAHALCACGARTGLEVRDAERVIDAGLDTVDAPTPVCSAGETRVCYDGPPATRGIGLCRAGVQRCLANFDAGITWSPCEGEVLPAPTRCDGIDRACTGMPFAMCLCEPGESRPCYDGPAGTEGVGSCHGGTQRCVESDAGSPSMWSTCDGEQLPSPVQCDGIDHACSGTPPPCDVVVHCPPSTTTRVGASVMLAATASASPPATLTGETWSVSRSPTGSTWQLSPMTSSPTLFSANESGVYDIVFTATDDAGHSASCTVAVTVTSTYLGTEFWAVTTSNSLLAAGDLFHFAVAIGNANSTPVTTTITGGALTAPLVFDVPAQSAVTRTLPWVPTLSQNSMVLTGCPAGCCDLNCCTNQRWGPNTSALVSNGAYHITTSQPVSAYQFNPLEFSVGDTCPTHSYSNDASLLLPATALTGNYLVLTHNTWGSHGSFVTIVGTSSGSTTVRVDLSSELSAGPGVRGAPSGSTQMYTLAAGDVLQLVATGGPDADRVFQPQDMTGTVITASNPVAVIAGVDCTNMSFPRGDVRACDHVEQQMFPLETWGNEVVVSQLRDRTNDEQYMVRILSRDDGNVIRFVPPTVHAAVTLDRGHFVEFESNVDFQVTGTTPILVAQFMEGQFTTPSATVGDPSMVLEVPTAQYRRDYSFVVPATYTASFVNVVGRADSSILLDGVALVGTPSPIAGSTWSVWRQSVMPGPHRISTTGMTPFEIKVLGVAERTSYAYPGGLDLGAMP